MKQPSFLLTLYYDFGSFQRHKALELINSILAHSPETIEKAGVTETSLKPLHPDKLEVLSSIAVDYPRYLSANLFLKSKKGTFLYSIDYLASRPVVLQIYVFDKHISWEKLSALLLGLADLKGALMGGADTYDKYLEKHKKITTTRGGTEEEMVGQFFDRGLPGIYALTFFASPLAGELDFTSLPQAVSHQTTAGNGHLIQTGKVEEKDIRKALGERYFFDIQELTKNIHWPPRLQERMTFLQGIDRRELPIYTDEKKIAAVLNQPEAAGQSKELTEGAVSRPERDKRIRSVLADGKLAPEERVQVIGTLLENYWAKKLSVKWSRQDGIVLFRNEDRFTINPYNCAWLVVEDNLDLGDFEEYLNLLFSVKL